jgi:hypothetical protein
MAADSRSCCFPEEPADKIGAGGLKRAWQLTLVVLVIMILHLIHRVRYEVAQ